MMKFKLLGVLALLGISTLAYSAADRYIEADYFRNPARTKTWTPPAATDTLVGRASTDTLTNKTIAAASNTITGLKNAAIDVSAEISLSKLAASTANRVPLFDAFGLLTASSVSNTTLGYLDATSSIQTQIDGKQASDGDLTSIAAISGTNVIPYRSAANTYGTVTIGSGLDLTAGTLTATAAALVECRIAFKGSDDAYGSTGTRVPEYDVLVENVGSCFSSNYGSGDDVSGTVVTVLEDGVYCAAMTIARASGSATNVFSIGINSSAFQTTTVETAGLAIRFAHTYADLTVAGGMFQLGNCRYLEANDTLRVHTDGLTMDTADASATFEVSKVAN